MKGPEAITPGGGGESLSTKTSKKHTDKANREENWDRKLDEGEKNLGKLDSRLGGRRIILRHRY